MSKQTTEQKPRLEDDIMFKIQNTITDHVAVSGDKLFELALAIKKLMIEARIETELSMIDKLIYTYQEHGSLDNVFQVSDLYAMRMKIVRRQTELQGDKS